MYQELTSEERQKIAKEHSEYKKEWYEENKDRISAKDNVHHDCECGGKYTHSNKVRHERSKKHQDFITP